MTTATESSAQASEQLKSVEGAERPPSANGSDGESERTREKLKKTSIAGLSQHTREKTFGSEADPASSDHTSTEAPPTENGFGRGRPSKKRSFEDIKDEQASPAENTETKGRGAHKRMRSREITHDAEVAPAYTAADAGSPLQEEADADVADAPGGPGVMIEADVPTDTNAQTAQTVEEKILDMEDTTNEPVVGVGKGTGLPSTAVQDPSSDKPNQNAAGLPSKTTPTASSGFSNTSSASPFGAVKSPPKDAEENVASPNSSTTSTSAFASSGLAAFASQDKSPFGASGSTKSTGGFGGGGSSFGSGGTGFGKATVGGGFGSGGGFGGGAAPSSFGGSAPSLFGAKSAFGGGGFGGSSSNSFGGSSGFGGGAAPKSFGGAPSVIGASHTKAEEDDEDGSGDEEEAGATGPAEEDKPDSRFHKQDVETGEEGEQTIFSARAKLYHFDEKQWKERGTGVIKVNIRQEKTTKPDESEDDHEQDPEAGDYDDVDIKARVIMRSDGVHRVILNSPVFKDMKVGTTDGDEPSGKTMYLTGMDEGKPRLFQIKMGKEDTLRELYFRICEFRDGL
ncbi:Ran-specific GTPase-activating protein 2 [Cyphellophora attinorum]|uniref:Ran-specific GTPase-activating protein 2 n=1 Tax=Cyphellophora attinorum TaxID=1664694 RepID=A0A0N1P264_9EURO|nr:Ran-specific GTPase-activating protein 2 [Phialophora attinorum]KPI43015.1 Ran-specific GTPase-activating protein 2 [Phialophora attinorum]